MKIARCPPPDGTTVAPIPTFEMDAHNGGPMKPDGSTRSLPTSEGMAPVEKFRPVLRDHDPSEELGPYHRKLSTTERRSAKGLISGVGPHVAWSMQPNIAFPWCRRRSGASVMKNQFVPAGSIGSRPRRRFRAAQTSPSWAPGEIALRPGDDSSAVVGGCTVKTSPEAAAAVFADLRAVRWRGVQRRCWCAR